MNQFEMKQLAYRSQLKSRALQVLLYLIDRANKDQTCFPAVSTIGRELHISISTVKRAMRELVEAGYVEKESRFREENRGQTSNLYTLHFPEKETEPEQKENVQKCISRAETEAAELEDANVDSIVENGADWEILYLCVQRDRGGVQSDTTLNFQFIQRLKSGKIVFIEGLGVSIGSFTQKGLQCPHGKFLPVQAALPP